jgi:NAD(P)-dependent dehydrogenase (short-subunit alcohol dehydrogenase family)
MPTNSTYSPVFITGVSRGLGRSLAESLIAAGHTVIGCARNAAAIEALKQTFAQPHAFAVVDVTDADAVECWVAEHAPSAGESVALLINNAGRINKNADLWEVDPEEFKSVLDVNVRGTFHCIRAIVPRMIRAGGGGIVNLSSAWGTTTSAQVAPYCASKWGIEGLTQALAQELPPPLFTVAVNPGVIHTEMLETCLGDAAKSYPSPKTWAAAAMPFLLSLSHRDNGGSLRVPL